MLKAPPPALPLGTVTWNSQPTTVTLSAPRTLVIPAVDTAAEPIFTPARSASVMPGPKSTRTVKVASSSTALSMEMTKPAEPLFSEMLVADAVSVTSGPLTWSAMVTSAPLPLPMNPAG